MIVAGLLETIGAVASLIGGFVLGLALIASPPADLAYQYPEFILLGRFVVALPGLSLLIAGLLLIGAGHVITQLREIARSSRRTAALLDEQFHPHT